MTIVFDISTLCYSYMNNAWRTGVWSVGSNLLRKISCCDDVKLLLYCDGKWIVNYSKLEKECNISFNVKLINNNRYSRFMSKLYITYGEKKKQAKKNHKLVGHIYYAVMKHLVSSLIWIENSYIKKYIPKKYIYFSPATIDYYFVKHGYKCSSVLHDTIPYLFPEYFNNRYINKPLKSDILYALNNSGIYFANSENTKRDFLKLRPDVKEDIIKVMPLACNDMFVPKPKDDIADIKKKYNIPKDSRHYIFSLCTIEPRKNLIRMIKTFIMFCEKNQINDLVFVLGGTSWDSFIERFKKETGDIKGIERYIYRAGYVDDDDLPILYSNAMFFVYTSQYEGFGLPPLEAMSCGCPVIVSNNSSLPEVVGSAGIMIDFDSDEQHIQAYEKYDREQLRREREAAEKRAALRAQRDRRPKGDADQNG